MPNGNTGFHIPNYFSDFGLSFSFIFSFCEFNRVAIRNKDKCDCCTRVMYYAKRILNRFVSLEYIILVGK